MPKKFFKTSLPVKKRMFLTTSLRTKKKRIQWSHYIHANPKILVGKPVVKGTRLSVDFILRLFANGWTRKEIFESYPQLTPKAIQAVFAYAGECMSEESLFLMPSKH